MPTRAWVALIALTYLTLVIWLLWSVTHDGSVTCSATYPC